MTTVCCQSETNRHELAEEHDQHRERDEGRDGAVERRAPPAREADGENYRQRFGRLNGRAEERSPEGEELLVHLNKMAWCGPACAPACLTRTRSPDG
jgi:hypothetical protein